MDFCSCLQQKKRNQSALSLAVWCCHCSYKGAQMNLSCARGELHEVGRQVLAACVQDDIWSATQKTNRTEAPSLWYLRSYANSLE